MTKVNQVKILDELLLDVIEQAFDYGKCSMNIEGARCSFVKVRKAEVKLRSFALELIKNQKP